jgi:catalase
METTTTSGGTAVTQSGILAQRAADLFVQAFGNHPGFRLAHAKGLVCEGVFEPSPSASRLSRAAHLAGQTVPVIARFSNSTGVPQIPDGDPNSNPKGFAIRFKLPGGAATDIVANGKSGFIAGTAADFVDFLASVVSTRPDSPHPNPVEQFMASHPASAAYATRPARQPASFGTARYFGNNAFVFVNARGWRQAVRYQIIPLAGEHNMDPAAAAAQPPDFLFREIKERIAKAPVEFRLVAQLAQPGDRTSDATLLWPDTREQAELGIIRLTSVDPNSAETERSLIFDPVHLTDGIELSDDPLPEFRSQVYSISYSRRQSAR